MTITREESKQTKQRKIIAKSTIIWGGLYTATTSGAITALSATAQFPETLAGAAMIFIPCGAIHGLILAKTSKNTKESKGSTKVTRLFPSKKRFNRAA